MANLTPQIALTADCSQCAALCCVSLAFDKGNSFGIDKPAGVACPKLGTDHLCTMHSHLTQDGFSGCVAYDCLGAGQRVTQELFDGTSWQDRPAQLPQMMIAFASMRKVHELIALLNAAADLPLTADEGAQLAGFVDLLNPDGGFTEDSLSDFTGSDVRSKIEAFLKTLRHHLE